MDSKTSKKMTDDIKVNIIYTKHFILVMRYTFPPHQWYIRFVNMPFDYNESLLL